MLHSRPSAQNTLVELKQIAIDKMPRSGSYVDNAYNRSMGRVGMSYGTAVISRGSSGGGGGGSYSSSSYSSYSGGSSGRTYVDNSFNRSLGRVGLELGTAVHSSSSRSLSGSSSRTYVDNAMNRSLGRVGQEMGTAVYSTTASSGRCSASSATKTYVDNPLNRSLDRVGLSLGSAVQSSSNASRSSAPSRTGSVYVDNAYNRRLGRVGKPIGTAVVSSKAFYSSGNNNNSSGQRLYVDNPMNRKLGRVGKPLGSAPFSSRARDNFDLDPCFAPLVCIDPEGENLMQIRDQIRRFREDLRNEGRPDPEREFRLETAEGILCRHEAAITQYRAGLSAPEWVRGGEVINFGEIDLGDKLGGGGFGDVHAAIWKGNLQVAVKKLRVQRVSQKRKEEFQAEVRVFSGLSHPCIVKFFGVCVTPPNLAIVMEFMPAGSLYDVLHVECRGLAAGQKSHMILDCWSAVAYLHERNVVHRDIKSMNILVCDDYTHCKIGDFGLALKEEARSSASVADHGVAGTLKYSPPEVVEGKRLTVEQHKAADVYSLTIVVVEILTEKEPYARMNQHQVRAAILSRQRPSLETLSGIGASMKSFLEQGMASNPEHRPSAITMWSLLSSLELEQQLARLTLTEIRSSGSSSAQVSTLPASAAAPGRASSLRSTSSTSRSRRGCPVCLSNTQTSSSSSSTRLVMFALRCGHGVCESCLAGLRTTNAHCPQCRGPIDGAIRLFL